MTHAHSTANRPSSLARRQFLTAGAASVAAATLAGRRTSAQAPAVAGNAVVVPPPGKRILLSCKLAMIPEREKNEPLAARLRRAAEAGFDGVDLDDAGKFTPEQARAAVQESGVFVHNAINHAHWKRYAHQCREAVRDGRTSQHRALSARVARCRRQRRPDRRRPCRRRHA